MANGGNGSNQLKAVVFGLALAIPISLAAWTMAKVQNNSERTTAIEVRQDNQDQLLKEIRGDIKTLLARGK